MLWLDAHDVKWIKCREKFPYFVDNKKHMYNPDIYLPEFEMYIEVKGAIRENDPLKFEAFPSEKNLVLLLAEDLIQLGIDVFIPKQLEIVPGKWPSKILEKLPEKVFEGELSAELKAKVSNSKFFAVIDHKKTNR